jgi:hypothetical protein
MITGVAILVKDDSGADSFLYVLQKPHRHHHCIHALASAGHKTPIKGTQGFVDENDKFYTREAALLHAQEHNQLLPNTIVRGNRLHSEDVW